MAIQTLGLTQRAERLAATLPPLLVEAERVAATVAQGVHGRRRVGQGETFWQFRRYQPGDPAKSIDWRQSAKTQRLYVRENEWEAAQSIWLWRDASPSMAYHSARDLPEKKDRAELLLLALAALLLRSGEQVSLLHDPTPPARGRPALARLAESLTHARAVEWTSSLPAFRTLPRYGQLVLIGDFLSPLAEIEAALRPFAAKGVQGYLLQVLDPAEETLPQRGRIRFEGLEGEGDVLIRRVDRVRGDYLHRLDAQRAGLMALTRQMSWTFGMHRTDRPPQAALLAIYAALSPKLAA
jgi:uncharacterized protein (DUF58 family)